MKKVRVFIFFYSFLLWTGILQAQDITGANFLKIGVGPRQISLGSAFTGVGDDVYTLYWNPAGIGFIRRWELSAMYNKYFADMYYASFSAVKQFRMLWSRKTAVGISVFHHGMPDWDATEGLDLENPSASASNTLGIISFGQRLDWLTPHLSIGVNAKFGYSKLMEYDAQLVAMDIGAMYRLYVFDYPLMIGVAAQHIGRQQKFMDKKIALPLGFRGGLSYRILRCPLHQILVAVDFAKYKGRDLKIGFGAEYWLWNLIGLHGGYNWNQEDLGDISFGASVRLDPLTSRVRKGLFDPVLDGFQFDNSRTDFGEALGNTNNTALSIHAVSPEPFRLLEPDDGSEFCRYDSVVLKWEATEDPDFCDKILYRILVDPDTLKIKESVDKIVMNHKQTASTLIDFHSPEPYLKLPFLEQPITYYWSVLAFDNLGHSFNPKQIRFFIRSEPDIIISEFEFLPSDTLPALDDDHQGTIKVVLQNKTNCVARNFNVVVTDFFTCDQDPEKAKIVLDTHVVRKLAKEYTYYIPWETKKEGLHYFHISADCDNKVKEMDETNNENQCEAMTIPRGEFWASADSLKTKKISFDCCQVPLIPIVFFDSASARVHPRFYEPIACEPLAVLKLIADRLKQNPDISIDIYGYIDPESESGAALTLGRERSKKVYEILVDTLGVLANQVHIAANDDSVTNKRIDRAPVRMVDEENRRVELRIERSISDSIKHEMQRRLFGPQNICLNDALRDSMIFYSGLASFSGCSAWQLLIKDKRSYQTIRSLPFRLSRFKTHQEDSTSWVGNNQIEQLVDVNQSYDYTVKVQDKLGRWFETTPKHFYIEVDTLNRQERYIFPMVFDDSISIYQFYEDEMKRIAAQFIDSVELEITNMPGGITHRALVLGSTCNIGSLEANYALFVGRRNKFIKIIEKVQREKYGGNYSKKKHLDQIVARVDESGGRYNIPAKNIARMKGVFSAPLVYYSPCCCYHDILYGNNETSEGRNYNRRTEIVLYREQAIKKKIKPVVEMKDK